MIDCPNCGTPNGDGNQFCNNCGERLAAPPPVFGADKPVAPGDADQSPWRPRPESVSESPLPASSPHQEDASSKDLPEWLRKLRAAMEADQPAQPQEPKEESLPSDSASSLPAVKTTEEWLAELRENPPEVEDQSSAQPPPAPQDPTWVRKLSELAESEESAPQAPADPAWVRRLGDIEPAPTLPSEPALAESQGDLSADQSAITWLQTPAAESAASAPSEMQADERAPSEERSTGFWGEAEVSLPKEDQSSEKRVEQEELPDWLSQASAPASADEQIPPATLGPEETTEEEPIPLPEPAKDEEVPEWIKRLQPRPLAELAQAQSEPEEPPQPTQEPIPEAETSEAKIGKRAGETAVIPDWLRLATRVEDSQEVESSLPGAAPIEPARPYEVPSWVTALRPPSLAATKMTEDERAASALLEGLPGVVPLALAIAEPHGTETAAPGAEKPKGGHLFESILAATPAAGESALPSKRRRQLSARPVIYLLLLLAVVIPFLLPDEIARYSLAITDTTAANFFDVLRTVPSNGTVLIAFDYEPSVAGEMDLIANAIVRDLAARNVRIIALSTLPTGPQVAQHVFDNAIARNASYAYGSSYINLGYVAGQEAGLAQLATNGFAPGAREYIRNQPLGQYPLTANLKNLSDVRLIIELAGSEEPLKMWMEQVQPRTRVQTIAGVSAAIEPRAQAYRDAKQLSAYMSGLVDAARLEVLGNRSGLAVGSVNALGWAQMVLVLVIAAGNVVYWVSRVRGKTA